MTIDCFYRKSWKAILNQFGMRPIQKFEYTLSKGSTDTALIIDAMDLIHSKLVTGFCIVSSDSDYTGIYMYTYIYIYICLCIYIHMCVCIYIFMYIYTCICSQSMYIYIYIYIFTYTGLAHRVREEGMQIIGIGRVYMCMYVYIYVCMYLYICMCIYTCI
jgi:hypothetical protein